MEGFKLLPTQLTLTNTLHMSLKSWSIPSFKIMASISPQMSKFHTAMQHIYRFPTEPPSEPWTPPPMTAGHKGRYL